MHAAWVEISTTVRTREFEPDSFESPAQRTRRYVPDGHALVVYNDPPSREHHRNRCVMREENIQSESALHHRSYSLEWPSFIAAGNPHTPLL